MGLANAQRPADRRESPGACRAAGDTALRGHKRLSKKWVGSEQGTDSTEGVVTSAAVLPRGDGMEDSRLDLAGERGGAKEQAGKPGKQEAGFRGCCRQRPRLEFRSEGGQRACLWGSGGFLEGCVEPADCQWGPLPGGRDAHWRLPAKPGPSLTPHPCRSQSHLLQEASPEPRRRALPTRAGVPGALATAYTDPGITSLAPLASVQAQHCVAGLVNGCRWTNGQRDRPLKVTNVERRPRPSVRTSA